MLILGNNLPVTCGGPFTRFEPSDPENATKKSCLDLVLFSPGLVKFIKSITIDSEGKYKMARSFIENGVDKLKPSDHYPIIISTGWRNFGGKEGNLEYEKERRVGEI